ncbi:MAG: hypothetical protein HY815_07450, partial [Candidatus Riflebacteria bacterium]|nr:hypothetical protein [Candidatus Riflebacteria bacterium]
MSASRLRRLASDHERVVRLCEQSPFVKLLECEGTPPERYRFEIRVSGLVPEADETQQPSRSHRVEVFLPGDYPRRAPFCRMLTPVFHPNIDPTKTCIGDHWSAGQSLPLLIVRIAG